MLKYLGSRLTLLIILFGCISKLQASSTPLTDYFAESWTTQDGLPHNSVNSIVQTPDGYLWFATWEGVVRYNGRRFTHFGWGTDTHLRDSGIRTLAINSKGELLAAGSRGSFARYANHQWHPMPQLDVRINQVLTNNAGELWIATNNQGLYRQTANGQLQHFDSSSGLPSQSIKALFEDNNSRIWVGTTAGLAYLDRNSFHVHTAIPDIPVVGLTEDSQGALLVASEQGLFRQNGQDFVPFYQHILSRGVSQILADNQNALWVGTVNDGLYRLHNGQIEHKGVNDGLPDSRIKALYQDREGSIWVGTNGGLVRLRKANFTTISSKSGLVGDYARTVLVTESGSILVGTSNGLSTIDNGQVSTIEIPMPNGDTPSILSLAENDQHFLLGTYSHGLLMLNKQNGQLSQMNTRDGLLANHVRSLLVASDNSLWIGTTRGLNHLTTQGIQSFDKSNGLTDDYIMAIAQDPRGGIWIGSEMGAQIIHQHKVVSLELANLDETRSVYGFHADKDGQHMWLATDRGLIRYRYTDGQTRLIGRQQGLPINKFWQVTEDNQGFFWLTSNLGMVRIPYSAAHQAADNESDKVRYRVFADGDGMQSFQANGTSSPAIAKDQQGNIWVATAKGVVRTRPEDISKLTTASLPMQMEAISVDGKTFTHNLLSPLPAQTSRIRFEFVALGYIMPQTIQYQTRLVGFDRDWISRDTDNTAEYTNLPPGDYIFEAQASYPASDAEMGVGSLRQAFSIKPAFWQRLDVILLFFVFVIVLLLILIRTREHLLRVQSQKLKQQVQEQTQALQEQAQRFARLALQDQLTGLENRRSFDSFLKSLGSQANRNVLAYVAIMDIDHFKLVNDNWSHDVGDQVIREVGRIIAAHSRPGDHAARWGGEEFSLIIKDVDETTAVEICERIRKQVASADMSHIANGVKVTLSVGIKQCDDPDNYHRTLVLADQALYHAKASGRNKVQLWRPDLPSTNIPYVSSVRKN
ncbi:ligand-binding sensor domain-containing diguanylate cyclase [Bowmanella denitrificans]|uniref:ligand-binding sensor domain-containing diguanylate cyclase n=1 Tax=Bowmanella denitrificans TaxID=366582 RepID=UPI000C9B3A71|nr:ligand-binding sensor domain-containing diguanylate cyclase [Bowmanella denitrificans]